MEGAYASEEAKVEELGDAEEVVTAERERLPLLPAVEPLYQGSIPADSTLVSAVGFEERSLGLLTEMRRNGLRATRAVLIDQQPASGPNRWDEMKTLCEAVCEDQRPRVHKFLRFHSSSFLALNELWQAVERDSRQVIVDVTGMSKFLILAVLWASRDSRLPVSLVYFRPTYYLPTQEQFNERFQKRGAPGGPFLTGGESTRVLTSPWLSSVVFSDRPTFLVAFPNFDSELVSDAIEELTPERMLLVEPGADAPDWWSVAYRQVNSEVYKRRTMLNFEPVRARVHEYSDTVAVIEDAYHRFNVSHRIVVSPTGSKMQAIGSFFMKIIHPEIEIIYPAPVVHNPLPSVGVGPGFRVQLNTPASFFGILREVRRQRVSELNLLAQHRLTASPPRGTP